MKKSKFFHHKTYYIFLKISTNLKTTINSKINKFHPFLPITTKKKNLKIFINKHFQSYTHLYFPIIPILN